MVNAPSNPAKKRVYIIARDIQRDDAVGNFCVQIARLLRDADFDAELAAENCHPEDRHKILLMPDALSAIEPDATVMFHFSTYDPSFAAVAALPNLKVVYFHNITPPRFFDGIDDHTARLVREGLDQRPLCKTFDVLMANSRASARTLWDGLDEEDRDTISLDRIVACPPVIGADRWDVIHRAQSAAADARSILFVGRLVPHKGIGDLITGFAHLAQTDKTARLVVVGGPSESPYIDDLRCIIARLQPDIGARIAFYHGLSDAALKGLYLDSRVCVSMSEHEGFGVPLLDAMVFDKPLVIRAEAGMMETAGDAAIVVDDVTPEHVAAAMASALDDEHRRARLAEGRIRRLSQLRRAADGHLVLDAIKATQAGSVDRDPLRLIEQTEAEQQSQ